MDEFDLSESLTSFLSDPSTLVSTDQTGEDIEGALDATIESLTTDPSALLQENNFDILMCILLNFANLSIKGKAELADVITSGLASQAEVAHEIIESDEPELFETQKQILEMYSFLTLWLVSVIESASPHSAHMGSKSKFKAQQQSQGSIDAKFAFEHLQIALEIMCKVQKLKLSKLFVTSSERDLFISLYTRSAYLILENENAIKNHTLKMHVFKVLCIAIKYHNHGFAAQTSLIQNLLYYDHLSESIAELLQILAEQYDHSQLTDEILRELSNKQFSSNDVKGPKSVSVFLIKLSEVAPRSVMQKITVLVKYLDSEVYALRCAIVEVCGNLIIDLSHQEDLMETHKIQLNSLFDVLDERFLDINPYCRSRTIQVYTKLCELDIKLGPRRQQVTDFAIQSLQDKSSHVRRHAIKLVSKLMASHPFAVLHGGQLKLQEWSDRLQKANEELKLLMPPLDNNSETPHNPGELSRIDEGLLETASDNETPEEDMGNQTIQEFENVELINKLKLTKQYYQEAINFISSLHKASELICSLLLAKNKSEVSEAMEFFVIADAYKLETARHGIRKMLHLIWTNSNNDEGKGIQIHLVECYRSLFFTAPEEFSERDSCTFIARNLISLTYGASAAELTSLERLLLVMMKNNQLPQLVIQKLWQVYGVQQKDVSKSQRRGAIIVLGMLAAYDKEIVVKELETLYHVGLGSFGKHDLVLAKYSCIALQRMCGGTLKLANDHPVVGRLIAVIETYSESQEWYSLSEQALNALYGLAKRPDIVCSNVIRSRTRRVFLKDNSSVSDRGKQSSSTVELSQLLFLVGHIAIKQIVLMESYENEFKRRKIAAEKDISQKAVPKDEMDLISGTSEDDFTEAINHIRENELLYDRMGLLSSFGGLVAEICSDNLKYNNSQLQISATLCLAKLMCVSASYCEAHLPLLLTILEKSQDAVTRSNIVIALGDMAVCFNHLIDENTDFLYRRLHDSNSAVQRTCLMTLTFLILAGQVKVKGQLGEMAKCLEDGDKGIADLARMFFSELARKDNAIYNSFTDIFSTLTADSTLGEEEFRRIIKFLSAFIEKEKQAKQLAEKLAARLPRCETERQWNDVAYALSLVNHKNEEIQKTVQEGFKVVSSTA
ncbi:armadillo-type protein [Lipomyces oligophaga]|uniref:armadillo-type protein n=1 Tax=Lipomyces oligophaga TaxID=45792 RepID=UPI0034CD24DB